MRIKQIRRIIILAVGLAAAAGIVTAGAVTYTMQRTVEQDFAQRETINPETCENFSSIDAAVKAHLQNGRLDLTSFDAYQSTVDHTLVPITQNFTAVDVDSLFGKVCLDIVYYAEYINQTFEGLQLDVSQLTAEERILLRDKGYPVVDELWEKVYNIDLHQKLSFLSEEEQAVLSGMYGSFACRLNNFLRDNFPLDYRREFPFYYQSVHQDMRSMLQFPEFAEMAQTCLNQLPPIKESVDSGAITAEEGYWRVKDIALAFNDFEPDK